MKKDYLKALREGEPLSTLQQAQMVLQLSLPAIMAQISHIIMQYIDASMVGRLGAGDAASIGLVASSTWLFNGLSMAAFTGFTVQAAQRIGAGEDAEARNLMKEALLLSLVFGALMAALGAAVSFPLPRWLGGEEAICLNAGRYFLVFALSLPIASVNRAAAAMLQASGNMRVPSLLNILMCALDVVFNYFFIFPGRTVLGIALPGAGLGVTGAALGTALSQLVTAVLMLYVLLFRSASLRLRRGEKLVLSRLHFRRNRQISIPVAVEEAVMCGAYILGTGIVAPLGTVAIAANSFAVTAESLCYMPGYGIGAASATIIGQNIGAGRHELTGRLGWLCTLLGVGVMTVGAALMYWAAPWMIGILSPDEEVVELGSRMLRIVAFAEPFYAASIVASGVFRGAGDTLVPSLMNFGSMWLVRLPLAAFLCPRIGLRGFWVAMSIELVVRGSLFLLRQAFKRPAQPVAGSDG